MQREKKVPQKNFTFSDFLVFSKSINLSKIVHLYNVALNKCRLIGLLRCAF